MGSTLPPSFTATAVTRGVCATNARERRPVGIGIADVGRGQPKGSLSGWLAARKDTTFDLLIQSQAPYRLATPQCSVLELRVSDCCFPECQVPIPGTSQMPIRRTGTIKCPFDG